MSKKIIVAGHVCLDIAPAFQNHAGQKIADIFRPGYLIPVGEADVHVGGCVSNTGLALKILGADVSLMGKIGKDAFGELVYAQFEKYDAANDLIISEDAQTSYSVALAPIGVDRFFLHNSGANDQFYISDMNMDKIKDAALFHFGYPPLMKSMYSDDGEQLICLFKKIKQMGIATSLDMALVDESSRPQKTNWRYVLEQIIPYVDIFVPSVEELAFMLEPDRYAKWIARADGNDITSVLNIEEDVRPLAEHLLDLGAKVVLIKCGAPGMYFAAGGKEKIAQIGGGLDEILQQWADIRHFEKSYKPSRVLSGTGAGDTSIAAFLYAAVQGYSWEKTLQLTTATGASCVQAYDALSGLKTFAELEEQIANGWEKS